MLPIAVALSLSGRPNTETTLAMVAMVVFLLHITFGVYGRTFSAAWRALWAGFLGLLLMQLGLVVAPYLLAR
jgi:hypothetical protein